ncbi:MAG: AMP-binding protein [Clostridia bacterium]|nr:AMP-binding protein [Clostridia bacterium]
MNRFFPQKEKRVMTDFRSLVVDSAESYGEKDYLKYKREGEIQSLSFRAFGDEVRRLTTALFEMGLSGKRIAVIGETTPEWIMTYLSVIISGGVIVPLDRELQHEEICGFLNKACCEAVFHSPAFTEAFTESRDRLSGIRYFVTLPSSKKKYASTHPYATEEDAANETAAPRPQFPLDEGFLPFAALTLRGKVLLDCGDTTFDTCETDLERMCAILFTSGTTGTSKGVMLSQKNLVSAINSSHQSTEFSGNDILVSVLPTHHTYEMTCGILTPLLIGATVCINESLKTVLKSFMLHRPTALVLVPLYVSTIYKKIWDTAEKTGKKKALETALKASGKTMRFGLDLRKLLFSSVRSAFGGRLKMIVCGGAPLNPDFVPRFDEFGISIVEGYGITECAPLISVNPAFAKKYHSVGPAVAGLDSRIDAPDAEGIGEICVKGPNVMLGYYEDPAATEAVIDEDGWFHTGDAGYIDEDGYIFITGRQKNVIVLNNGKNVFPEEIEEHLLDIELIRECVVVGRENEEGQTVGLTALIFPDFDRARERGYEDINATTDAVKREVALLNKTLPGFKQIRGIEIRQTEFVKTTTKKIKRHKVNEE